MSLAPAAWNRSITEPTEFYLECLRMFQTGLPVELQQHRAYFSQPGKHRGYGEDAFHVMWHLLFREFKPANFLEIGVFRGQTISLASLCARLRDFACDVHGISPFSPAGDSVSKYRNDIDYYADTIANFKHFALPTPHLLRAYSTDAKALELLKSKTWEMIYIDGNHDYEIVKQDWEACSSNTRQGGIIVFDDAGLTTGFHPPRHVASRGHPGPSRLAQEVNRSEFQEILQVGHNRVFQKVK
jgi:hypothetical protein